jgi:nucleoside-diphosphate-sugar epimerase
LVSRIVNWAGQRVLVTGATGFIGCRLVRWLVAAQAQVYAGAAPGEAFERVDALPAQAERLIFDLRDAQAVQAAVAESAPQVVVHLAAVGVTNPGVDPGLALAVNTGGTLHLLEALRGRDVRRVVLAGTCYEYGAREAVEGLDPFNAYAASKVAAWAFGRMYWRAHGLPVVVVRPFQVYGPGQPAHTLIPARPGGGSALPPGCGDVSRCRRRSHSPADRLAGTCGTGRRVEVYHRLGYGGGKWLKRLRSQWN